MVESLKAPDLLRNAARLVERARQQLDGHGERCGCCKGFRFTDLTQARIRTRLEEMPRRLNEMANQLSEHDNGGEQPRKGSDTDGR